MMNDKQDRILKLNKKLQDFLIANNVEEQLVYGFGNCSSDIVLVGEAPGAQEVIQGRPFVGKAGKNLDDFLLYTGIERENVYITNVVKYRPYRISYANNMVNRAPTKDEIDAFRPFLVKEIKVIDPRVIVTLGNTPLTALSRGNVTIGRVHGMVMDSIVEGKELFPLYHPASIIYNPNLRDVYLKDLEKLKTYLG